MKELDEIFESLKQRVDSRRITSLVTEIDSRSDWPAAIGALTFGPVIDYGNMIRTADDALLARLTNIAVEAIVGIDSLKRKQRAKAWLAEFNERVPVGTEITVRAWSITPPFSPSFNKARVVAEAEYQKEASEPLIGIDITDGPQPAGDNFVSLDDIKVVLSDGWAYIGKNFEPRTSFTISMPAQGIGSVSFKSGDQAIGTGTNVRINETVPSEMAKQEGFGRL